MKKLLTTFYICFFATNLFSQQIDLANSKSHFSKKNLLKLSGNFSANSVYYSGNEPYARDPFNYYLTGNINMNIMSLFNMPFTFNFTNSGSNYTYPSMPNRFALHPSYKWVNAHLGDVSMNFSPYTLNGHLFTGFGIDINPTNSPLKISGMYGRLRRAVEYGEGNSNAQAAYKRMGSGTKIRFEKPNFQIGTSILLAKDDENSLKWKPDSLSIYPSENLAFSFDLGIQLIKNMRLNTEYGISILKNDLRNNTSKNLKFHAYRFTCDYTFMNNTIGLGYERIDPGYKTLGAYYFNNDLENITLNFARPFLNNKGIVSLSGGIEHDNLNKEKESQTRRFIASTNISYAHSENLNFNLNYSSFQTYMNLKSQFEYLNELTPYDNLDTLNYTQISQNITLVTNYTLKRGKTNIQNLNINLSLQETADKQGDIVPEGGSSLFSNVSLGYGLQYLPKQISTNLSLNLSTTRFSGQDMLILGPSFSFGTPFFDKNLITTLIASYNTNYVEKKNQASVWNLRFNAGYTLHKKHRFNFNTTYRQNQNYILNNKLLTNGLTITTGYNYNF